jgi:hypothetical protein
LEPEKQEGLSAAGALFPQWRRSSGSVHLQVETTARRKQPDPLMHFGFAGSLEFKLAPANGFPAGENFLLQA